MNTNTPPLLEAITRGDRKKLRELLDRKIVEIDRCFENGETPLILAISHGYTDIALLLIARGADINLSNNKGISPLMAAGEADNYDLFNLFIIKGADISLRDSQGENALHKTARLGHAKPVQLLLQKGLYPHTKSGYGQTPQELAQANGHKEVVSIFKNFKTTEQDKDLFTMDVESLEDEFDRLKFDVLLGPEIINKG
ncbi:MAG: ankyrin repeat domain-containing protein [Proteobacteria bacterium]|nr:ankyrin repeat domain-containing protein [Pseudomonadota bacterium]MBU1709241.1 ankyrin repeat domain-containing protein [Pseudomonadota bacterium]